LFRSFRANYRSLMLRAFSSGRNVKYFGSFRLDPDRGTLLDAGRPVRLTRKAAALLHCLIQHAPVCVGHDEILAAVWPETHVQPDNIKVLIREIRQALDDDPHAPRYIRNEPGRGYAFTGLVAEAELPQTPRAACDPVSVTRLSELTTLHEHLDAAGRGTPRMIFIAGERGSGRTSLSEVFLERASAGGALVAYAQGLETAGAAEPYGILRDALLQLRERYPERVDTVLSRHPGALPRGLAGRRKAPWAVARAVRDICRVLGELAREETVVIVIDDLQWGDRYTLDVLRAIARWRHTPARILFVATHTLAPAGRMTAAIGDLRLELHAAHGCGMIRLGPLDARRLDRVIGGRFDDAVARAIGPSVLEISGGHPGTVAALLQHLAGGAGMNLPVSYWSRAERVALTATLQDGAREPFLWRLANLDRADRQLLEIATVVGMSFTAADVAMAQDGAASTLTESLDRLADWGLIVRAGDPRAAAGSMYRFWHASHAELVARGAGGFELMRAASNLSRSRNGQFEIA
jgi:DNA-binding winged helix-turn-helix (wHTH) protein